MCVCKSYGSMNKTDDKIYESSYMFMTINNLQYSTSKN